MKKSVLFAVVFLLFVININAQVAKIDTMAVFILDRTTSIIGSLNSCSFELKTQYDVASDELGLIKHTEDAEVFMHGPNKMLINLEGDKGNRSYWYNGKTLSYYSFDNSRYAEVKAPATIMKTIDSISTVYGIEFPAADFFYPAFVDDLLAESSIMSFLGNTEVNGQRTFHIAGVTKYITNQFWISDDAYFLPVKISIVYKNEKGDPQYEARFQNWKVNPDLPPAMFEFSIPPGAIKTKLIPKEKTK